MLKRKYEEIEKPQTLCGTKRKFRAEELAEPKKPRRLPLDILIAHYKGNISRNETARVIFHFYT